MAPLSMLSPADYFYLSDFNEDWSLTFLTA